jgi:hypothetical protein
LKNNFENFGTVSYRKKKVLSPIHFRFIASGSINETNANQTKKKKKGLGSLIMFSL